MQSARFLAFSIGFISMSLEILWVRLYSFTHHSLPQAFASVLVFYLIGIALGANLGRCYCSSSSNLWKTSGIVLLISSGLDSISSWLYAWSATTTNVFVLGAMLICMTALLKAIIFPIVHVMGTLLKTQNIGHGISRVYVANIFGATLGPLFMGVFLLDFFTTQQCFFICAGLTFLLAMYCLNKEMNLNKLVFYTSTGLVLTLALLMLNPDQLLMIMAAKPTQIRRIVENKHGIVVTYRGDDGGGDYITGGNVYDGRTNLDPVINSNQINRLTVLSVLQDKPEHVLMIGLSIGTWLKIITTFPGVKHIDVVEINPGYLTAINDYPRQKSGLDDPRVQVHIADGRHWLNIHPTHRYDLIIMNTTYHWRNYSTNLLSQTFLRLVKQHMNPGAVLSYNATGSPDVLKTASTVFKNSYLYGSFVIAADFDWRKRLHEPSALKKLAALQLDGAPLYRVHSEAVMKQHIELPTQGLETIKIGRPLEVITDHNLITEYKYATY